MENTKIVKKPGTEPIVTPYGVPITIPKALPLPRAAKVEMEKLRQQGSGSVIRSYGIGE